MKILYSIDGAWVFISPAPGLDIEDVASKDVPAGVNYEIVEDDDPRLVPIPAAVPPHLNNGGLVRFSGAPPTTVLEAIRVLSVLRLAKGRYRVYHETEMPSDQYAATVSVMDVRALSARVTARTPLHVEVRISDLLGVAQDPTEATVETKRVIYPQ